MRRALGLAPVVGGIVASCFFPDTSSLDLATDANADGFVEGSADVGDAGGDAQVGYCASLSPAPTFCDDFDEGSSVLASWDNSSLNDNSTITLDQTIVKSPPSSMLATVTPQSGAMVYPADFATKNIAPTATSITFSADVYVERIDPGSSGGTILAVSMNGGDLCIDTQSSGSTAMFVPYVNDAGQHYGSVGNTFTMPFKQWVRFALIIDVSASTVEVTMDTGQGAVTVVPAGAPPQKITTNAYARIGLFYGHSTTVGWLVHYDNVVLDVK